MNELIHIHRVEFDAFEERIRGSIEASTVEVNEISTQ